MSVPADPGSGPRLVTRVMTVLSVFDETHTALSLSAIARRTGLPLSTTHRVLTELERGDFVARTADGSFIVGAELSRLGQLAPEHGGLRDVASAALKALSAETGFDVALAVPAGRTVLYVDRVVTSTRAVANPPGARFPLATTAAGKAILAHSDPQLVDHVLGELAPRTPWTVTDPRRLRHQLAVARDRGYACNRQECHVGLSAVAAPVMREPGVPAAALVVVSPNAAVPPHSVLEPMRAAAESISRVLPFDPSV